MDAADYTTLCVSVAGRPLGVLGTALGAAMAAHLPAAEISAPLRLANFVGQTCHETARFQTLVEYGGPGYFAKYDGRRDLGNTQPGDGFRYRGRGLIQITGRANFASYGHKLGLDLVGDPDLAMEPDAAVLVAARYWTDLGLNAIADASDVEAITRRINGGLNGLAERQAMTAKALAWLNALPPAA